MRPWPLLPEAAQVRRGSIWVRPVPSQYGLWASDYGDIWSTRGRSKGGPRWRKLRKYKDGGRQWDSRGGYLVVGARNHARNGKPSGKLYVHLLVAEAWHGPRPDGCECDHKDEDHLNNSPENLQWLPWEKNLEKRNGKKKAEGMHSDEDWEGVI